MKHRSSNSLRNSKNSLTMSSNNSVTNMDIDQALFMIRGPSQSSNKSWDSLVSDDSLSNRRRAKRFEPAEMKRLGISNKYKKFHNITKDSGLAAIPCKRLECQGILTNIGPTPKRAYVKLARARQRMLTLINEKDPVFTHSCCFTCSVCADKKTPKHSWQRWCALCDAVYSNNGFFQHHGGNQGRGDERPLEKRIMQHKQNLWDKYVYILESENPHMELQNALTLLETLPLERKWLVASLKSQHNDMRAGIESMNSKWIHEKSNNASSLPLPPTAKYPIPASSSHLERPPRFSTGRNYLSVSDAARIREIAKAHSRKVNNRNSNASSLMSDGQMVKELDGIFSSMSAMSVDDRASSRPLSFQTGSSQTNRPLSIDSTTRPISLDTASGSLFMLNTNIRRSREVKAHNTNSSWMSQGLEGRGGRRENSSKEFRFLNSNPTDETVMSLRLPINTSGTGYSQFSTGMDLDEDDI